jgi:hypothetical protein
MVQVPRKNYVVVNEGMNEIRKAVIVLFLPGEQRTGEKNVLTYFLT